MGFSVLKEHSSGRFNRKRYYFYDAAAIASELRAIFRNNALIDRSRDGADMTNDEEKARYAFPYTRMATNCVATGEGSRPYIHAYEPDVYSVRTATTAF